VLELATAGYPIESPVKQQAAKDTKESRKSLGESFGFLILPSRRLVRLRSPLALARPDPTLEPDAIPPLQLVIVQRLTVAAETHT
jgi:hypothetical protein